MNGGKQPQDLQSASIDKTAAGTKDQVDKGREDRLHGRSSTFCLARTKTNSCRSMLAKIRMSAAGQSLEL